MKSVTGIFIDHDVDRKVLFQPTPLQRFQESHKDQMSPLQLRCKISQGMMAPRALAHTCGPTDVRRHERATTGSCRRRTWLARPLRRTGAKGQNAPNLPAREPFSTALEPSLHEVCCLSCVHQLPPPGKDALTVPSH